VTRVRAAFGIELAMAALFETPTVAGLAERVAELAPEAGGDAEPIERLPRGPDTELPLSFSQVGRFHIRVKPDMCISCGNCSTYCEMGIDVRSYAQNNQSFTRAACVGCGMCAHMCPRGVLKLENTRRRLQVLDA
jgi:NAD-dependent dihydropyrimidine dehydrogenase PreA subunit